MSVIIADKYKFGINELVAGKIEYLNDYNCPYDTEIPAYAYMHYNKFKSIDLPKITSIGDYAFDVCDHYGYSTYKNTKSQICQKYPSRRVGEYKTVEKANLYK